MVHFAGAIRQAYPAGAARMNDTLEDGPKKRKASRESRRVQLIEATIRVLAREGYARTTLTRVAAEAGLSHGLVNFHFTSKEGLLSESLVYLAEEYRQNWERALEEAPDTPAARLDALLLADFEPAICAPDRLSAWCSFWGEAQSRPLYQEHCSSNDADYIRVLEGVCGDLIRTGGYSGDAAKVARVLRVTIEGVWLDLMTMKSPYSRDEAMATVKTCAAAFFPRHFDGSGLVA